MQRNDCVVDEWGPDLLIDEGDLSNTVDFERPGSVFVDGVEFTENVPAKFGTSYVHCGSRENKSLTSETTDYDASRTTAPTEIDVDGETYLYVEIVSLFDGWTGITIPGEVGNLAVHSWSLKAFATAESVIFAYLNFGSLVDIGTSPGIVGQSGVVPTATNRRINLYSQNAPIGTRVYFKGSQLIETKYQINPIQIPTFGSPATMATAASSDVPGNTNGLTIDLYSEDGNKWLELFDGAADGPELITNGTFDFDISSWTGSIGVPPTLSWENGSMRVDTTSLGSGPYQNISTALGMRIHYTADTFDITGSNMIRLTNSTTPGLGFFTTIASGEDRTITFREISLGPNTNVYLRANEPSSSLWDNVSAKEITPATGSLIFKSLKVVPTLAQWEDVDMIKIIMADDGTEIFYLEDDGFFKLSDGTNIAVSPSAYTAGQEYKLKPIWDGTEMWIEMDGVAGTKVPFVGTFNPGQILKFFGSEDLILVDGFSGSRLTNSEVGGYNGVKHQYYLDNGATSDDLQDAEYEFLIAQGATSASLSDMWFELLGTLGYSGSLSDRLTNFWCVGRGAL